MKDFYESINYQWQSIERFWFSPTNTVGNTQVNLLRQRYYSNLTYIDLIAKEYGEMWYWKKISLHALAFGISSWGIVFANPFFFIIGFISLNLLACISFQYQALENRFLQLVADLDDSEQRLNKGLSDNLKLESELKEASCQLDKVVDELGQGRIEVREYVHKIHDRKLVIENACEIIEASAKKSHQIFDKLAEIKLNTAQQAGDCVQMLSGISQIVADAIEDIRKVSTESMFEKLSLQNADLSFYEAYLDKTYADILNSENVVVRSHGHRNAFFS